MLQVWSSERRALEPTASLPTSGWVHVERPTADEVSTLQGAGISASLLAHALDRDEVPRVDSDDTGVLVVMRVPKRGEGPQDVPFRTTSLGVISRGPLVFTVSADTLPWLAGWTTPPAPAVDPSRRTAFVLRLMASVAANFLHHLREIERDVDRLEEELQVSLRNSEVLRLLKCQKALVHFTTGLSANEIMLRRLQTDPRLAVTPEDHELLEDVEIEIRQAIEMTRIAEEILSQMMDAFASIISNNLNVVMKVLTALTVVLTFPTMVASFYGMNVELPMQRSPLAFVVTLGVSVAVSTVVAVYFWRRRWL